EYVGRLVPNEKAEKSSGKYFFGVNKKWAIDGSKRTNTARYINHSCQPNAETTVSNRRRVWIWARRNIKPGEEITYDYGEEYFEGIIEPNGCKCAKCFGVRRPRRRFGSTSATSKNVRTTQRSKAPSKPAHSKFISLGNNLRVSAHAIAAWSERSR